LSVQTALACRTSRSASIEQDLAVLNCRVQQGQPDKENPCTDTLIIEVCGSISVPDEPHEAFVKITVEDITEGPFVPQAVRNKDDPLYFHDLQDFSREVEIGKLPRKVTTLEHWTAVAKIPANQILPPHGGQRLLRFSVSVFSRQTGQMLADAQCDFPYYFSDPGYLDREQNIRRVKALAVGLAFAVSAANGRLFAGQVGVIRSWARANIELPDCEQPANKLEKALERTLAFFRNGGQLDIRKICKEITEIAPAAQRYEIIELCLYVLQAKNFAAPEELKLAGNIAAWLEIDREKFRAAMEKILPVTMHTVTHAETVLGITPDMTEDMVRQRLSREYAKWSSRVTSSDAAVRAQAEQMLKLIAEARGRYVGTVARS
jgi:hypothetical protein